MTIDTRDFNEFGSSKFRTNADNGKKQMCYFNRNKSDTHFSSFLLQRSQAEPINFSIVRQIFDIEFINKSLETNAKIQCLMESLRVNFNKIVQKVLEMEDPTLKNNEIDYTSPMLQIQPMYESDNATDIEIKEENQDFSQQTEDKIVNRHKIRYTATRIKYSPTRIRSINFLSNIYYTGISKNDFYNENFILDVYVLLVKNLNPFSLSRKVTYKTKHKMVYMLWRECIALEFYRNICEEKNFIYLNGRDVGQPGVLEIVGEFIDQGKQNLRLFQGHLARYKDIYQYVYSHVFPEIYTTSKKRGFDLKSNFHILFKAYRDKQDNILWRKIKQITNSSQKNLTKTNKNQLKTSMNLVTPKNKKLKNAQKND